MPPKKASPATKAAPKTTTQKPAAGRTAAKPGAKKPGTTAAKPVGGGKGAPVKKGSTSRTKGQAKGKENNAKAQVLRVSYCSIKVDFQSVLRRLSLELFVSLT